MTHFEPPPFSLYLHVPFCRARCTYCSFNTYTGLGQLIPAYVDALVAELNWVGAAGQRPSVHTIYFGGGTPSILSEAQIGRIIEAARAAFDVQPEAEITLEANPTTHDPTYYTGLRKAGVNRISFGAQSAQEAELRLFHRTHDWPDVIASVSAARKGGFDNLSLDLIYGIPGQSPDGWRQTLEHTLHLNPDHLSMYSLGIEAGTAMAVWIRRGLLDEPDSDLAADMYEQASEILAEYGYEQYEISNWARPGYACRHNLQYWRNQPYLGLGPGAHGYAGRTRYAVVKSPWEYVRRLTDLGAGGLPDCEATFPLSPAVDLDSAETLDPAQERAETMFLGLRLIQEGVSRQAFQDRFGKPLEFFYRTELDQLAARGLLEARSDRVRLTGPARLISNIVFEYFV